MRFVTVLFIAIATVTGFLLGRVSVTDPVDTAPGNNSPLTVTPAASAVSASPPATRSVNTSSVANNILQSPSSGDSEDINEAQNLADVDPDNGVDTYSSEAVAGRLQYAQMRNVAMDNYPAAQQELDLWTDIHKTELKTRMDEQLGQNSGIMFDQIMQDNAFINEPLAQQPLEEDIAWREQTSTNIRDFIMTNNADPALTVLDVICIQKKCEVTLTGKDTQAAGMLYTKLMQAQPFGISGSPAFEPTSLTNDDGTFWMYLLLYF